MVDTQTNNFTFNNDTEFNENYYPIEELNCSICTNELCFPDSDYQLYEEWISVNDFETVLIILHTIQIFTGILGNLLVFIAVTTTKSMQSVTNIFIVNLAMADMLVMLFCAPPSVIWDVTNTWIFGSVMCKVVIYIQDVSVSVSVLTLTFIAYDRYHAICKPLQFNARKTKVAKIIGGIWTVAGIIGIPDFSLESKSPFDKNNGTAYNPCMSDDILFDLSACTSKWNRDIDFCFMVTKALVLYTLPLLLMLVAYYYICKTLWKTDNQIGGCKSATAQESLSPAPQLASNKSARATHKGNTSNNLQILQCNGGSDTSTINRSRAIHSSLTSIQSMEQKKVSSSRWRKVMPKIWWKNSKNEGSPNFNVENSPTNHPVCSSAPNATYNRNLDNQLKTRRKVAKMLIAVVTMFAINFFPVHFIPIFQYIVEKTFDNDESQVREKINNFLMHAGIITHFLCYFNSAVNPIIYYFMSAQFKTQYRRILTCARCNGGNESLVKSQTTRATKLVNTIKVEHGKRYDRSSVGTKKCVGSNLNKMSNISATMQFKGFPQSVKDVKMDMSGLDGNGANKKNGCNKSITLKVNPKGSDMKATDGYIETCENSISQTEPNFQRSIKDDNKRDQIILSDEISNSRRTASKSLTNGENTKKWSFDQGPCPCTNGSIKNKPDITTTSAINHFALSAVSVCPSEKIKEAYKTTDDDADEDGYDGEGDRLLIADLSPICSTVVNDGLKLNSTSSHCHSNIHNCLESPNAEDVSENLSLLSSNCKNHEKSSGPTVHSVKAKRISILTTSSKFKSNDEVKGNDDINGRRSTSQNQLSAEDETVT